MKSLFKADIVEKILINKESLESLEELDSFTIGGKVLFNDLSSLKYINNLSFIEKLTPNLESFEYKDFKTNELNGDAEQLIKSMDGKTEGKYLEKALVITPYPQDRAEGDYEFIVIFKSGESAVKSLSNHEYSFYKKTETNKIAINYGIDSYLINRKLQNDFEVDNQSNKNLKFKVGVWKNT